MNIFTEGSDRLLKFMPLAVSKKIPCKYFGTYLVVITLTMYFFPIDPYIFVGNIKLYT